jgi:hypothetical protein
MTDDEIFGIFLLIALIGIIVGFIFTTGFKSQSMRLVDFFIWGPLVIACAFIRNFWTAALLVFIGASTMSYNLKNYFTQEGFNI